MAGTAVRVMYSLGLILTSPLQLFPAVKVSFGSGFGSLRPGRTQTVTVTRRRGER